MFTSPRAWVFPSRGALGSVLLQPWAVTGAPLQAEGPSHLQIPLMTTTVMTTVILYEALTMHLTMHHLLDDVSLNPHNSDLVLTHPYF